MPVKKSLASTSAVQIDVDRLPAGLYFVEVKLPDSLGYYKLIIDHSQQ
jgi:hypothetical protein